MIVNDGVNSTSRLVLIRIAIIIVNVASRHVVVIGALLVHDKATKTGVSSSKTCVSKRNQGG